MRVPALSKPGRFPRTPLLPGSGPRPFALAGVFGLENLCRSCRKNRRGTATVEFAVVAPLFFLLLFGIIEFGRMVMVQQVLTNASREGARVAVLNGATTPQVTAIVQDYLSKSSIEGAIVTVTPDPPDIAAYGAPVTVAVSVPFGQVSWLPSPMFLGETTLSASTVMHREIAD